jgi:NAD-dependent SIR2 family protein deacetylase
MITRCHPNAAHLAISAMENQGMADVWVATQNVDGVCRRADSKKIIKLHGNIYRAHCIRCGYVGERSSGIKGISDIDYTNEFNSNGKSNNRDTQMPSSTSIPSILPPHYTISQTAFPKCKN